MNTANTEQPTVTELFDRDPLQLSAQNLDSIIDYMRQSRAKFVQGSLTAGKPATAKVSAAAKKMADVPDLDLKEFGL